MTAANPIQRWLIGPLQLATRGGLRCHPLRPYIWRYIIGLRTYYGRFDPPVETVTRYEGGIRILTSLSSHIEAQIFWQGFQEADEGTINCLKATLPEDGVFIDIGANVGTFTLVGAKRAPRGEVHAFEPSAYHFKRLADNIARNGFRNVQLNQLGLFDEATEATLYLPLARGEMSNTGAASMFKVEGVAAPLDQQETIRLMRLDDYVTARNLNRLDIIKIDIEGAELNALRGAVETLRRFRPLVLMEVDLDNLSRAGSTPVEVLEFWHDLNYRVKRINASGSGTPIAAAEDLKPHQNIMCLSN